MSTPLRASNFVLVTFLPFPAHEIRVSLREKAWLKRERLARRRPTMMLGPLGLDLPIQVLREPSLELAEDRLAEPEGGSDPR